KKSVLKRCTAFMIPMILFLYVLFSIDPIAIFGLQMDSGFIPGGFVGGTFAVFLSDWIGITPAILLLIAAILILISGFFRFSLSAPFASLKTGKRIRKEGPRLFQRLGRKKQEASPAPNTPGALIAPAEKPPLNEPAAPVRQKPIPDNENRNGKKAKSPAVKPELSRTPNRRPYVLPGPELLKPAPAEGGYNTNELNEKAQLLTQALAEFNVDARVVNIIPGPVITMYELQLGSGVRINRIENLENDIARIMAAKHVRIIAPIPGKTVVGVEIPNRDPDLIYYHSIVNSSDFRSARSLLTIAVGKTTEGHPFTFDLAKMPHLLVAGTTGSGKSVCINTIIMSILYRANPDEVKFILIDPKMIELSIYRALEPYHLITSEDFDEYVITNAQNAIYALRSAVIEMESRYVKMLGMNVRNIEEYNEKMKKSGMPVMPYIVIVIDELADLMNSTLNKAEIELPFQRLAQKSRAVGLHLVVATQRPSVDVITGVIRANFPARIAFAVASKTDSRTILDVNGAEQLLGRGDMLFLPRGRSEPIRLHNAFISLEEIESVLGHISRQPQSGDDFILPTAVEPEEEMDGGDDYINGDQDPLFNEALKLVITHQQGSASLLQRRLKVGYSRAGRLIDELEAAGIVGPSMGSKAREVLVGPEYLEHLNSFENGSFDDK
ncbi:MAG: DNA translocase FtsK 4TM domain-containing protein, partial [bacterium]|nr:DNA translocase FtsK 4TM domain-containing protein [bacterium]